MKNLIALLVITIFVPANILCQENDSRYREIGIFSGGFNNIGIRYKSGVDNSRLRLSLSSFSSYLRQSKSNSEPIDKYKSHDFSFDIGFEKRKTFAPKISFFIGSDLSNSLSLYSSKTEDEDYKSSSITLATGLGLVLGFNYEVNDVINLSLEAIPSISYVHSYSKTIDNYANYKSTGSGINFGLYSNDINITLSFNLGKKN